MRIVIASHFFHPSIGGTEEVGLILAQQFSKLGHEVKVVTTSQAREGMSDGEVFEVIRRPGPLELFRVMKWSEVVFHNNLCLQMAWPLLLLRRPWVVAHHTWIRRTHGGRGIRDHLKRWILRFARNTAVSRALAADLPVKVEVIGNPYREEFFFNTNEARREEQLLFVGRLVPGKGVEVLIEALRILRQKGEPFGLTILGEGPERARLEALAADLPVEFGGVKPPAELAKILNAHPVLVIPSMCDETFGIIALEGIACGCLVIGSDDGGLPDAIGSCGRIFPKGNAAALAAMIESNRGFTLPEVGAHLARHRPEAVARAYLNVIQEAIQ